MRLHFPLGMPRRLGSPSPVPSRPGLLEHCGARCHWPHIWAADLEPHVCPGHLPLVEVIRRKAHAMLDVRLANIDRRCREQRARIRAAITDLNYDLAVRLTRGMDTLLEERHAVPEQRESPE